MISHKDLFQAIARPVDQLLRKLWVRVAAVGLIAFLALFVAHLIEGLLPTDVMTRLSGASADRLLQIIANAMLAVTTFSLTVMVTVHRNTSSQFTPRAHTLVMEDRTTQNTLAAFIGTYVYALVAIILRETGVFLDDKAFVLFWTTVGVICFVIWSLIRWVLHLQTFGSLLNTTRDVEGRTRQRFEDRLNAPCLGAQPLTGAMPDDAVAVLARSTGFLQWVMPERLQAVAEDHDLNIYLPVRIGDFVFLSEPILYVRKQDGGDTLEDDLLDVLHNGLHFGDARSFDQDPRLGLMTMSEIGSKALSPGINDPGTAIDAISRIGRILSLYKDETAHSEDVQYDRLHVPPLEPDNLLHLSFASMARDGAALIEVQLMLQKVLAGLIHHPDKGLSRAARAYAQECAHRAMGSLAFEPDKERLRAAVHREVPVEAV